MQKDGKVLSIIGLVLGILALCMFWVPMWNILALIFGIAGIILSVMGKKQAVAAGVPTGLATAGLVISIIGTVFSFIGFFTCTICAICVTNAANDALNQYGDLLSDALASALN